LINDILNRVIALLRHSHGIYMEGPRTTLARLCVEFCNIDLLRKSVVNMGNRLQNKVPDDVKKLGMVKSFKRKLLSFLLQRAFYSVDEFVILITCVLCECVNSRSCNTQLS